MWKQCSNSQTYILLKAGMTRHKSGIRRPPSVDIQVQKKKSKKGFRLPRRSLENIREWTIFILTIVLIVAAVVVLCILFPWFLEIIKWLGTIIGVIIFFIILVMIFG